MENKKVICAECGNEFDWYDTVTVNGDILCEECLEENYDYCEYHECYEPTDNVGCAELWNGEEINICSDALENYYYICDDCGCYVHQSDVYHFDNGDFCPNCQEENRNDIIKYYHASHDVSKTFHGNPSNDIYYGLEIESERSDYADESLNCIAKEVRDSLPKDTLFFENDGSLNYGFETISNPMSYEFMRNNNIIERITNALNDNGMEATGRCGVHIHVSRTEEVDNKIPQIIMFLENNKDGVRKLSDRSRSSFNRWCDFYTSENEINLLESMYIALNTDCDERYHMLNITNNNTIEFRLFAGTLNSDYILGYIQFAQILVEEDLKNIKNFRDIFDCAEKRGDTHLRDILLKRRIV